MHPTGDGWIINGSLDGMVAITFHTPVELPKAPLAFGPVHPAIGIVEVEDFVAALTARI